MKRRTVYILLVVIVTVGLYLIEKQVEKQAEDYPDMRDETYEMDRSLLPASTTNTIINHVYYSLSYSEENEQAEWVAYELNRNQISDIEYERPYFVEDRLVKTHSADWHNYKGSGYDKGHLCPAGDRTFSYAAYHETFLTSNISPQDHDFNAGIWNRLEMKTREWAKKYNSVFVVTGPVFGISGKFIGEEKVTVPESFYKIILRKTGNEEYKAIVFVIPNRPSNESIFSFTMTIDQIETITGIDFFPGLDNSIENEIESINNKVF